MEGYSFLQGGGRFSDFGNCEIMRCRENGEKEGSDQKLRDAICFILCTTYSLGHLTYQINKLRGSPKDPNYQSNI